MLFLFKKVTLLFRLSSGSFFQGKKLCNIPDVVYSYLPFCNQVFNNNLVFTMLSPASCQLSVDGFKAINSISPLITKDPFFTIEGYPYFP